MSKKKTEYRFIVNADPASINMVMNRYLIANKFTPVQKTGANYFFFNDPIIKGKRSLEYYINGNEVIILAYLGTFEKPKALEGVVGALPKQSYKNDLQTLFQELQRLNIQGTAPQAEGMSQQMNVQGTMPQQANNNLDVFVQENNKKQETWTIVGFVLSLIGLVLAFFGVFYGAIILVLEFYCAIQGLKTKKKGLAIATIVIACVSLAIIVLEIALAFLLIM